MTPAMKAKLTHELSILIEKWGEKTCDTDDDIGIYWSQNYAHHMASAAIAILDAQTEAALECQTEQI